MTTFIKWIGRLILPGLSIFLLGSCHDRHAGGEGKTVFRYNEAANITSLDPAFARDQSVIWATHQLFDGLVQLGDRLEILPSVARSWEISEEGTCYTFHLRMDVKFHDSPVFPGGKGRGVTAADFCYSFNRITDGKVASPGSWIFNPVRKDGNGYSFKAPDDSTFIIRLAKPFPPFLGLLSTLYCSVLPKEAIDHYGPEFRRNPVGTGPFCFKMWKEGVKLVFTRNLHYFENENGLALPYLDAVAITFLADRQSAFLEFMKGNLDFMSGIDPAYKDEILTRSGRLNPKYSGEIDMISRPYLNTEYLGFLIDSTLPVIKESPVRLKKIREAINTCFDREKMIRFLRNNTGYPGIHGMIPPGMPGFDSSRVYWGYDPQRTRLLLAEAGFPGGQGLPPVTLVSTPDYLDICKYIQSQANEAGIDLRIEINPPAAMKEMRAQAKVPFFRASWIADYPDAENYLSLFYSRNFCPGGPNYTHFSNRAFDALYEKAMTIVDDSARYGLYRQMEDILMSESPVVVLYYDQVLRFIHKDVHGLGINPMNLLTLKKVRKIAAIRGR